MLVDSRLVYIYIYIYIVNREGERGIIQIENIQEIHIILQECSMYDH